MTPPKVTARPVRIKSYWKLPMVPSERWGKTWATTSPTPHKILPVMDLVTMGRASKWPSYQATKPPPPLVFFEAVEVAAFLTVVSGAAGGTTLVDEKKRCCLARSLDTIAECSCRDVDCQCRRAETGFTDDPIRDAAVRSPHQLAKVIAAAPLLVARPLRKMAL